MIDTKTKRAGDKAVAQVNGTSIYQSDLERAAAAQGLIAEGVPLLSTDAAYKTVLEELIDQRLLALDAMSQSLDQTPETKRRLQAARERLLGNIRIEDHLKTQVNETTIRKMYEAQVKLAERGQERRARHILLRDKNAALDVFEALQGGANFTELAREKSIDSGTANKAGDLGYFSRDMLDTAFTSAVFKADIGDRIAPFKTEYGWHVTEVMDARTPPKASFEEMRPQIVNFMTFDAIQSLLKDLRESGEVTLLEPSPPNPAATEQETSQQDTSEQDTSEQDTSDE